MRDIVIPGHAKHEPGISRNNFWIPGLRLGFGNCRPKAHAGMTD
jgi:hypothetical protein